MSVNKVILVGNVGKDPDVRHLEGGVTVARFPLATNESYTDKSGKKVTQTEWHNIVVWRGLADVAEKYVRSGKLLYVEGRIRTSSYDDKEGNKRYSTEIVCDNFRFLSKCLMPNPTSPTWRTFLRPMTTCHSSCLLSLPQKPIA